MSIYYWYDLSSIKTIVMGEWWVDYSWLKWATFVSGYVSLNILLLPFKQQVNFLLGYVKLNIALMG